jgi:hypothetical protein
MIMSEISVYHPVKGNLLFNIKRYIFSFLLFCLLAIIGILSLNFTDNIVEEDNKLSDRTLIIGAKRFISYLYSFNSETIEEEQFSAMDMMANDELRQKRLKWIIEEDYINRIKNAKNELRSKFNWKDSKIKVLERTSDKYVVDIETSMVISGSEKLENMGKQRQFIHQIITFIAVERSDENDTGVGVIAFRDVAKKPLINEGLK